MSKVGDLLSSMMPNDESLFQGCDGCGRDWGIHQTGWPVKHRKQSGKLDKNYVENHTPRPNKMLPNPHQNQHTVYRCKGEEEPCKES